MLKSPFNTDPLANAKEDQTFAGDSAVPAYLANAEIKRHRSLWEAELTISNLESMLALTYESLTDLKAQIEDLKKEESANENARHERGREITKRQTELAAIFAR